MLTLSSSLHTLSLASLRELLLSCALENEEVASHIIERLHSQDGVKSPNLENFRFHHSIRASGDSDITFPSSPDIDVGISPLSRRRTSNDDNIPPNNVSSQPRENNYNNSMFRQSGEIKFNNNNIAIPESPRSSSLPSWNWSYYYYKESSSGATAKRDDVDEGTYNISVYLYLSFFFDAIFLAFYIIYFIS